METENLGNKYALAALRHKRATLAGEIALLEKQASWKRQQLESVDATLTIFGEADPTKIKGVRRYKHVHLFKQGQLSTLIRDVLRRAGKPLKLAEIVAAVMTELGEEGVVYHALQRRVRASLQYLQRDKGAVTKEGKGQKVVWRLSSSFG